MRAHILETSATRPRLVEVDRPAPGPGGVLVRTTAVAINPLDVETAAGGNAMVLPIKRPFVLGVDFVGRVEALGPETQGLGVGDRVFGYRGMAAQGAFAELQQVPVADLARAPEGMSDEELAALPLPALCALQAVDEAGLRRPGRVLVHGGAGGVGSVAVQVYARLGHEVVATASAADAAWVERLGAKRVIDFGAERFETLVKDVDLVLDTVGGEVLTRSFRVMAPGGVVCSLRAMPTAAAMRAGGLRVPWFFAPVLPLMGLRAQGQARAAGARLVAQVTVPSGARLGTLRGLVGDAPFAVRIHQTFAFDALSAALDLAASGKARGRLIVTVP
jgi:NADPH:quinone reductase-like Zn-dependent oxidoreductase